MNGNKKKLRLIHYNNRSGFTLVETIVACVLLMMLITVFGTVTLMTTNLSFREKEQSQTEILTDTLINRVDETLRFAKIRQVETDTDGKISIRFTSETYPEYGNRQYAELTCDDAGHLIVKYNLKEYPLLPEDSYEAMEAELTCRNSSITDGTLYLALQLDGKRYGTAYQQDFSVKLVNG